MSWMSHDNVWEYLGCHFIFPIFQYILSTNVLAVYRIGFFKSDRIRFGQEVKKKESSLAFQKDPIEMK